MTKHAQLYYKFRVAAVPLQCVASSSCGCLGGYRRVNAATALSFARAALEVVGVAVVLATGGFMSGTGWLDTSSSVGRSSSDDSDACMLAIGLVYVACVAVHATLGVGLVVALTPEGAPHRLHLLGGGGGGRGGGGGGRGGGGGEVLDFVADGASMLIRSFLLQGSFFAAMVVAARELGPHGLAAHHVVTQLWMVTSYLVDGFATAGTVLGSAMVGESTAAAAAAAAGAAAAAAGAEEAAAPARVDERVQRQREHPHQPHEPPTPHQQQTRDNPLACSDPLAPLPALRWLCHRLLALGLCTGIVFAGLLMTLRETLIAAFTRDPSVAATLRADPVWHTLAGAQPLNALVFVYDGLIYAFQGFGFVRELMEVGVGFVFLPALAAAAGAARPTLAGVWAAKVGLNVWRAAGLGVRIHGWLLTPRGLSRHALTSSSLAAGAAVASDVGASGDIGEGSAGGVLFSQGGADGSTSRAAQQQQQQRRRRRRRGGGGGEGDTDGPDSPVGRGNGPPLPHILLPLDGVGGGGGDGGDHRRRGGEGNDADLEAPLLFPISTSLGQGGVISPSEGSSSSR